MYAYSSNLQGMVEHLNAVNERRSRDNSFSTSHDDSLGAGAGGRRELDDLDIIAEIENDETGMV